MDYPIPNRARAACSPSPTAQQQQDNNNNLSIRNSVSVWKKCHCCWYLHNCIYPQSQRFSADCQCQLPLPPLYCPSQAIGQQWIRIDISHWYWELFFSLSCMRREAVACPWHDDSDAPFQITIGIGMEPKTIIWIWVRNLLISQVWVEVEESNANGSITTFDAPLVQLSCYSLEQPTSSFGECLFVCLVVLQQSCRRR